MQKLAGFYNRNEIEAELRVYKLFIAKKDPAIFEEFTRRLAEEPIGEYYNSSYDAYKEYAEAIGKTVPKDIQKKIEEDREIRRKKVEILLRGYGKNEY